MARPVDIGAVPAAHALVQDATAWSIDGGGAGGGRANTAHNTVSGSSTGRAAHELPGLRGRCALAAAARARRDRRTELQAVLEGLDALS